MVHRRSGGFSGLFLAAFAAAFFAGSGLTGFAGAAGSAALGFEDMMGFRQIEDPVISRDGSVIAFTSRPDRGNPEVIVCTAGEGCVNRHELGSQPVISSDGKWVAAVLEVDLVLLEKEKDADPPLRKGMLLLDLEKGEWEAFPEIKSFAFSDDGRWLAYHKYPFEEEDKEGGKKRENSSDSEKGVEASSLFLRDLHSGREYISENIESYRLDPQSAYLALARADREDDSLNGIYHRSLVDAPEKETVVQSLPGGRFSSLAWTEDESTLAWISGREEDDSPEVRIWAGGSGASVKVSGVPEEWYVPLKNSLEWTDDSSRLFFGIKPETDKEFAVDKNDRQDSASEEKGTEDKSGEGESQVITEEDRKKVYGIEELLDQREMDVWHWNDPRIVTNQKERWADEKDRTYMAAVSREDPGRVVQLADLQVPEVSVTQGRGYALGKSREPYMKLITWEGEFFDLYLVGLESGKKIKIAEKVLGDSSISPSGEYAVFYRDRDWHMYSVRSGSTRNLTAGMDVSFADELHDYPSVVPGYGCAGWMEDSSAVLVYDRFDIWRFPCAGGEPVNLTRGRGREEQMTFRLVRTDTDRENWEEDTDLLLSSYRDRAKNYGFYSLDISSPGVSKLLEEEKKFTFLAKAEEADTLIYTREDYREFPDIWVSDADFSAPRKISDLNPQVADFAWGEAELVEWNSLDGIPLQGVLIKPGNYEEGKKYPVLVYFYRFFSQRLHEFNTPVINHRPCFPLYASNGYAVFLPDIRFETGRPGFASTKCLVPGVQKLVDMGIADPEAIGLHGHSWSGYQTAFIVTQTDIFAAAVAGAPVSNMTSAYGGIRWGTGLSRQFQYEQSQSRIGGSLWEYPERYIENSPLFFADRINTPMLIMFGDEDDAVPWYQGIELYMAMRRLEKDSVFLQYRGEPHHLKKYPNRLDYAVKMKEYFDHYLKGAKAPVWITSGQPYRGE